MTGPSRNDSDIDDIVDWHGLYLPSDADGAMEEGSPMIERGSTRRYTFTAKPSGTRWYHSHDVTGTDLTRSLYAGLYGFLIIESASEPGRYAMSDGRDGPPLELRGLFEQFLADAG
jgi:FtsP/CotA-like multicopper oxidase with cupredoxin domain